MKTETESHPDFKLLDQIISNKSKIDLIKYGNKIQERFNGQVMIEGINCINDTEKLIDDIKPQIIEYIKELSGLYKFEKNVQKIAEGYRAQDRWNFVINKFNTLKN